MSQPPPSLHRNQNFVYFWIGRSISWFGNEINLLAIPLIAIGLGASPFEMGVLTAVATLPYLLFGLLAGAWVDRLRRRPVLIFADIARAILLLTIPVAAFTNGLGLLHLIIIAFLVGTFSTVSDIAEESYLPALIGRDKLVDGYSKLSASRAVAEIGGPGAAGIIIELISAPFALLVDAVTFLMSAFTLERITASEPAPAPVEETHTVWKSIRQGGAFLWRHPMLRPINLTNATMNFFGGMFDALFILFMVQVLGLSAGLVSLVFVAGSVTGLLSAVVAQRFSAWVGNGRSVWLGAFLIGIGGLAIPFAPAENIPIALVVLFTGRLVAGFGNTLYNINTSALSQTKTPDHYLGRINAFSLFIGMGVLPIGSFIGGVLGNEFGTRTTLILARSGVLLGFFWVFFSPVRHENSPTVIVE